MITTGDDAWAERLRRLSLHGLSRDAWDRFGSDGYKHYKVVECGFKYNMMDLQAALGIHQLARIEKNDAFRLPATTPLPADMIAGFEGLNYYLPVPALRFRTTFTASAGTDTVRLTKRKGSEVPYVRRGTVVFNHEGKVHQLAVFGPTAAGSENYLWLPFYDETSSGETYPGGRYLDLTVDADGFVDLDFNFAYNPLCDYNADRYNCTLPPRENTLDFDVVAGEKRFSTGH